MDSITVITVTRNRPQLLERAILSVRSQDYPGHVMHLIIVDDCNQTVHALEEIGVSLQGKLMWHLEPRKAGERTGSGRLAHLRNLGVQMAESRWVAFLDDDNEYESTHLSSLVDCASQTKHSAIHSYRKMYNADGSPYLEHRMPSARDPKAGRRIYEFLCSRGVWIRDSNVLQDRVDPKGYPDPIRIVDSSEWLIEHGLLIQYPFPEHYTQEDVIQSIGEDDKLLEIFVEQEIPVSTTKLATLRYYLGGQSNAFLLDEEWGVADKQLSDEILHCGLIRVPSQ